MHRRDTALVSVVIVALTCASPALRAARAQPLPFVLIVHPDNAVQALEREKTSDLFLRRTTQWPDGTPVEPVDLVESSAVREEFSLEVHGRSAANIRSYWQRQVFSGGLVPPVEVASDAEVVAHVRTTRGAIGYVSAGAALVGVKPVSLVTPPRLLQETPAAYTALARRFRVQGEVRLRVLIDPQGGVKNVEVLQGLSHGLTEEAIRAVHKWKFAPGTAGGSPVEASLEVKVRFSL